MGNSNWVFCACPRNAKHAFQVQGSLKTAYGKKISTVNLNLTAGLQRL